MPEIADVIAIYHLIDLFITNLLTVEVTFESDWNDFLAQGRHVI